jgi:uncharacterized glyoxalase superfamily protein PhnB
MSDQPLPPEPYFASALSYRDPLKMLDWLEEAFGFERIMVIVDADGNLGHSEMRYGSGLIMVGNEWTEDHKSPASIGGKTTQTVHVFLDHDVDGHCERARTAGAVIQQEPQDQFYGARTYRARDPEGHIWTFSQTVKSLTPDEWDAASGGLKTTVYKPGTGR